jgi:hypothetical protein
MRAGQEAVRRERRSSFLARVVGYRRGRADTRVWHPSSLRLRARFS